MSGSTGTVVSNSGTAQVSSAPAPAPQSTPARSGNSLPMPADFYDNSIDDDPGIIQQDLDKDRTPVLLDDSDELDAFGNIIKAQSDEPKSVLEKEENDEAVQNAAEAILSEGKKPSKAKLSPKVKEYLKAQKDQIKQLKEEIESLKNSTSKYTQASELSEVGDVSGALKSVLGEEKYNEFLRQELDEQVRYENGNEYERQLIDRDRAARAAAIKASIAEKRLADMNRKFEERENNAIVQELHSAMVSARSRNDYSKFVKDKNTAAQLNEHLTDKSLADIKAYCERKGLSAQDITPKVVNYFFDKNARLYQSLLVNASKARSDKIIEEKKSQAKQEAAAIVAQSDKNIQDNNKIDLTNWGGSFKSLVRQFTKR